MIKAMNKNAPPGRNDLCPCGSGKKYKRCHGASGEVLPPQSAADNYTVNREIAYAGRIGREREKFCTDYSKKKNAVVARLQADITGQITASGQAISCRKGCGRCCAQYVEAKIQEIETIVHYLYHKEPVLKHFLAAYPQWRERIKQYGDLFMDCGHFWEAEAANPEEEAENMQAMYTARKAFFHQDIPCPFLMNQSCSIYPVRPFVCSGYYVTSDPEFCKPLSPEAPVVNKVFLKEALDDLKFFYKNLPQVAISYMPIAVYEMLFNGPEYYNAVRLPGFENYAREFRQDPEVSAILKMYGAIKRIPV
jgi:Fe-S-cluster containining protein